MSPYFGIRTRSNHGGGFRPGLTGTCGIHFFQLPPRLIAKYFKVRTSSERLKSSLGHRRPLEICCNSTHSEDFKKVIGGSIRGSGAKSSWLSLIQVAPIASVSLACTQVTLQ
jgi:hypothetical protein